MYSRWVIESLDTGAPISVGGLLSEELCRAFVARNRGRYRLIRVDVLEEWHEVTV